ncbi:MAG: tetratricopeptide repeat protein [Gemmataceae bacterium]
MTTTRELAPTAETPRSPGTDEPGEVVLAADTEHLGTIVQVGRPTILQAVGLPQIPGYEIEREVARGGMGIILAARDLTLDRDVAIKVLISEGNPEAVQRFILESKITARLPHPAIPPVHQLGTLADGNPFLVMKLIRGRTLAAEMKASDCGAELPRFVQIFEQIAQAVGFAHSQGIIHRDLKPANVMVGSFGDVQVMDWGLAKVWQQADSGTGVEIDDQTEILSLSAHHPRASELTEVGYVMGTPAYMAPEQARGEPLDPRSDVFSLGGILCDMLTGHPPFVGNTVRDTIRLAGAGDVTIPFRRLDACSTDPELIALCKRCLSPNAKDRPVDGKAVGDEVAAYRVGVEERLRKAETERVAAEARAVEEANTRREAEARAAAEERARQAAESRMIEQRKRRRVQVVLAGAIVALAGLIGVGAWWQDRQEAKRRFEREVQEQAERERLGKNAVAVEALLLQCDNALRNDDAVRAAVALEQAEKRTSDGGTEHLKDWLIRSRGSLQTLRELDHINDLRWGVVEGKEVDPPSLTSAWQEAFRRLGIIPGRTPIADAVATLKDSPIRERLLGALEMWFWREPSERLLILLQATDPDGYRNELRQAHRHKDSERVRALATQADALQQPPRFVSVIGGRDSIPHARREQILRTTHLSQPQNFIVLIRLALLHKSGQVEGASEAVGWYRAALAVRPTSVIAWNNLGLALKDTGDAPGAIAALKECIRLDPKYTKAHSNLGYVLKESGDPAGAVSSCREAIRLEPGYARAHNHLGLALRELGDLPGAIAAFKECIRLEPDYAKAHANLGLALRDSGDLPGTIAACREAIRLDPEYAKAHNVLGLALKDSGDAAGAIVAFKECIRLEPKYPSAHANLARAYNRLKRYPEAIAAAREAVRLNPKYADGHAILGTVLAASGDVAGGRAAFSEAVRLDAKKYESQFRKLFPSSNTPP